LAVDGVGKENLMQTWATVVLLGGGGGGGGGCVCPETLSPQRARWTKKGVAAEKLASSGEWIPAAQDGNEPSL